jgi:hypothetical protein
MTVSISNAYLSIANVCISKMPLSSGHGEVLHGSLQHLGAPILSPQTTVHHNLLNLGHLVKPKANIHTS